MATNTRVTRGNPVPTCAVCGRSLLLGEQVQRFRDGPSLLDVCTLCDGHASRRGWLPEGAPAPPPAVGETRPGVRERLRRLWAPRERETFGPSDRPAPVTHGVTRLTGTEEPARLRRAQIEEARAEAALDAIVASVGAFNASSYRRTVHGIAKSLGRPRVSIVPLGGSRPDVVVTVVWDLSWYQYRIDAAAQPPVRLEDRGDDLDELDRRWRGWNATTADDGALTLTID